MSSKRQQARNEKALQELVHNTPGNNICADCHVRNPGWASWSLGVFLCMRCAAIHRKLGTHISKVKSMSMDSWTNEQVDNMRKVGNVVSNQIYNPDNKKPPVPIDVDEADSAMERFIRQKYTNNVAKTRSSGPSSPHSDEGTPPPLPPKNSKFGFRSATSSLFPMSRNKKDRSASDPRGPPSPTMTNKPSKVFGANVDFDNQAEVEKSLTRLRDMGFSDNSRNAMVLKGVNGDLEKAVEALVRLGEGDKRSPAVRSPIEPPTLRSTKSMTPLSSSGSAGISIGLTVGSRANSDRPITPSSAATSNNPFDIFPSAQPQTAQSTGTLQNNNPYNTAASTNPFGPVRQQTDPLSQSFQGLSVSTPQPLFPNHTGGQASLQPQQSMYAPPPVPSLPSNPQSFQGMTYQNVGGMAYSHPVQQPVQPQQTGYNPFFSNDNAPQQQAQPQQHFQQQPQQPQQQNLSLNTTSIPSPSGYGNNPFARSPTRIASPGVLGQIPEQSQSNFQSMMPSQSPQAQQQQQQQPFQSAQQQYYLQQQQQHFQQPQQQANNPFFSATSTQSPAQMAPQQQYFMPQRQDNASIMALYGQFGSSPQTSAPNTQPASPSYAAFGQQQPQVAAEPTMQLHRAQTAPVSAMGQQPLSPANPLSSTNPFMTAAPPVAQAAPASTDPFASSGGRQATRESILLGKDMVGGGCSM